MYTVVFSILLLSRLGSVLIADQAICAIELS